ncbi:MAG: hypothetical protein ACI9RU_002614 [Litorivivens sp.]|jgi:hypothetical protein
MIRLIHITIFCFATVLSLSAQTTVKIALSTDSIAIGEQAQLSIEVVYPLKDAALLTWPNYVDTLTSSIEILSRSKVDTLLADVDSAEDYFKQVTTWTVTCFEDGFHPIPPMAFGLGEDPIESNALLLSVGQPLLGEDQEFKDIKGIQEIKYDLMDFLKEYGWYILLALVALGLIIFGAIKIKNRPTKEIVKEKNVVPLEPAHIIAVRELAKLKEDAVWQRGNVKGYYSRLTTILRTYIEHQFKTQALEETTDQIIRDLKALDVDQMQVSKFGAMLRLADLAKFAKAKPSANDNENSMLIAEEFLRETTTLDQEHIE